MCHELRNPLHVLKSTLGSLLVDEDDDAASATDVHRSSSAAQHDHRLRRRSSGASIRSATSMSKPPSSRLLMAAPSASGQRFHSQGSTVSPSLIPGVVAPSPAPSHTPPLGTTASTAGMRTASSNGNGNGNGNSNGNGTSSTYALLLQSPAEERRSMVVDVLAALQRMESTVNDVLDFRKLDENMFTFSRVPESVSDVVDSVCRHCRGYLSPGVQFGYRVSPPNARAMIDKRRMFQIIVNGLSNAGKYTPDGGVVAVDVRMVDEGFGMQYMVVTVSNTATGDGIDDPERLFVPFRGTHEGAAPTAAGAVTYPAMYSWCSTLSLLESLRPCLIEKGYRDRRRARGMPHAKLFVSLPSCRGFGVPPTQRVGSPYGPTTRTFPRCVVCG